MQKIKQPFLVGFEESQEITAAAMCSSGFRMINFQNTTNDDSRTNVKERTNIAIAYSRC